MPFLERSVVFFPVGHVIPGFDTNEGRILSGRAPNAKQRGLGLHGHVGLSGEVEELDSAYLTVVEDIGVNVEGVLVDGHDVGLMLDVVVSGLEEVVGAELQGFGITVVEAQACLEGASLFPSRDEEGGMATDLEIEVFLVGVLHMPDDVNLVVLKLVGDA